MVAELDLIVSANRRRDLPDSLVLG